MRLGWIQANICLTQTEELRTTALMAHKWPFMDIYCQGFFFFFKFAALVIFHNKNIIKYCFRDSIIEALFMKMLWCFYLLYNTCLSFSGSGSFQVFVSDQIRSSTVLFEKNLNIRRLVRTRFVKCFFNFGSANLNFQLVKNRI